MIKKISASKVHHYLQYIRPLSAFTVTLYTTLCMEHSLSKGQFLFNSTATCEAGIIISIKSLQHFIIVLFHQLKYVIQATNSFEKVPIKTLVKI